MSLASIHRERRAEIHPTFQGNYFMARIVRVMMRVRPNCLLASLEVYTGGVLVRSLALIRQLWGIQVWTCLGSI
jgi:hypothetical protein